jgi:hypothetical protein
MKKIVAVLAVLAVLTPAFAFAGGSTDAALGLGAFAVFNQILSGTGIFGGLAGPPVVAAPPAVVYAPPPSVVYAPPPPVVYAPAPVVYAPPPAVVVAPRPVVGAPYYGGYHPRYVPVYRAAPHPVQRWCPPGHAKHGRC